MPDYAYAKISDGEGGCTCPPRCVFVWNVIVDCSETTEATVGAVTQATKNCDADWDSVELFDYWTYQEAIPHTEGQNDCRHLLRFVTVENCCTDTCPDSLTPPDPPDASEAEAAVSAAGFPCPNNDTWWWEWWSPLGGMICGTPPTQGPLNCNMLCGTATEAFEGFTASGYVADTWKYTDNNPSSPCTFFQGNYFHRTSSNCCGPSPDPGDQPPELSEAELQAICDDCVPP